MKAHPMSGHLAQLHTQHLTQQLTRHFTQHLTRHHSEDGRLRPAVGHRLLQCLAALALLGLPTLQVQADSGREMPLKVPQAYSQECAACHLAYPPGLLPAASWQRIMNGLDRHYGTDASLEPAQVQEISRWLNANASTYKRVREEPPEDRITRSAWFERKHRKVEPAVWKLPSVKSAAQCAACHTGAEQGRFDDDHLRLPAGLSEAQKRAWRD